MPQIKWDARVTFVPSQLHFLIPRGLDPGTAGPRGVTGSLLSCSLTVSFHLVPGRQLPIR